MPNSMRCFFILLLLAGSTTCLFPVSIQADASATLNWLVAAPAPLPAAPSTAVVPLPATTPELTTKSKPEDQCQDILAQQGLDPNDVVWYAENPSGQIVAIKAQEACSICVVGNGNPAWKCTPVDPANPVDPVPPIGVLPPDSGGNGGSGGGFGGGGESCGDLQNALDGCAKPEPPIGTIPVTPTPPIGLIPVTPTPPIGLIPVTPTPPIGLVPVTPTPPIGVIPPDGGGSGGGSGGGTDGGTGGSGSGEIDILIETAKSIDQNSRMRFPNISREAAIRTIRQWFLPRNVDAQPRAITGLGVDLFHVLSRIECSDIKEKSSIWASALVNHEGEGGGSMIWNDYESFSSGFAAGACIKTDGNNKYGALLHLGKTTIDHESDVPGEYHSDNFGAGIYYIDDNETSRFTTSLVLTRHNGEQERTFNYRGVPSVTAGGARDATSAFFSLGYENTDRLAVLQPFAQATLSYIHQDSLGENGFPLFTLDFTSRNTWWLNLEGGLQWVKEYQASEDIDYRLALAGVVTFLTNISDDKQEFTYVWGDTLAIGSSGQGEPGLAFRFGLKRKPKDPEQMRIELLGSAGYQAEVVTYSGMLNFVFPLGD